MKKNKNLAAVLLNANLQGDNIGYQFNRDAEHPLYYDTALGYSLEEWESVKFAKILVHDKMGSTTLRTLENDIISIASDIDWDTLINGYLICLIRDPIGKYKSSIKESYLEHFSDSAGHMKDDIVDFLQAYEVDELTNKLKAIKIDFVTLGQNLIGRRLFSFRIGSKSNWKFLISELYDRERNIQHNVDIVNQYDT